MVFLQVMGIIFCFVLAIGTIVLVAKILDWVSFVKNRCDTFNCRLDAHAERSYEFEKRLLNLEENLRSSP